MAMTPALSFGSMFGGVIAEFLRRFGIGVLAVAASASVPFMLAQLGIVLEWVSASALLWALFGATFNVVTLCYGALSQHFPPGYTGRANAGLNVLSTGAPSPCNTPSARLSNSGRRTRAAATPRKRMPGPSVWYCPHKPWRCSGSCSIARAQRDRRRRHRRRRESRDKT